MRTVLGIIFYFSILSSGGNANAADLCVGIKNIIGDSRNQFMNFRGSFDFEHKRYVGSLTLGPFTTCNTSSRGKQADYKCTVVMDDWTDQDLKNNLLQIASQLKECFGREVSQNSLDEDGFSYYLNSGIANFMLIPGSASNGKKYMILDIWTII